MLHFLTGQGLAPGHKARLQNFEEFEMKFKECLSNSAIQTKFEQHYKQGLNVVQELEGVLGEEERRIQKERYMCICRTGLTVEVCSFPSL